MKAFGNTVWKRFGVICALMCWLAIGLPTARAQSKLSMSALLAPSYIKTSSYNDQGGRYRSHHTSLPLGAMLHYHFSDRWSASSGLLLEWTDDSRKESNFISQSHYFSIPILLNYQTNQKRLSPYFSAGTQLHNWKYWNYGVPGEEVGVNFGSRVQSVRIRLFLGAGLKYQLNEHLSLIIQPVFTYEAKNWIGARTFQYSLQTQLVCRF
ncbi:outer membrane beta-barrel protein [Telluribacter humicola]|uniref:outer membrane beta-barrel protein n=1 Tax=Telluribacter humicola TaxID=1720261 RepID=UPI001A977BDE|nr:outer membrane beta-barrel protein [Telluribacter humicola]